MNREYFRLTGILVAGVSIGFGAGYLVAKRRAFRTIDEQIASVRSEYDKFTKQGEYSTPAGAAEALGLKIETVDETDTTETFEVSEELDIQEVINTARTRYDLIKKETGFTPTDETAPEAADDEELVIGNVFVNAERGVADPNPNYKEEDPNEPILINDEQFQEEELTFAKDMITYYEADDTLVDEQDRPIGDPSIIGTYPLTQFGNAGEKDKDIIHVRNRRISTDFEITRDPGSYLETVHGIQKEKPHVPRFKVSDE